MLNSICIIGLGKLGSILAAALCGNAGKCALVDSKSDAVNANIEKFSANTEFYRNISELPYPPEIIFLSVQDSAIIPVQRELALRFQSELSGKLVIHCSGALPASILEDCRRAGSHIASVHPYQTLFYPKPEILKHVCWGIECEQQSRNVIIEIIRILGGRAVFLNTLNPAEKALYHLSAVAASNFLTASLAFAEELALEAEIDANVFFPPIVNSTINNFMESMANHTDLPLTGPIARGDLDTLLLHIRALEQKPELLRIYCYLSLAAAEVSFRHKFLDTDKFRQITNLLKECL